jgi:hypothetical protein
VKGKQNSLQNHLQNLTKQLQENSFRKKKIESGKEGSSMNFT